MKSSFGFLHLKCVDKNGKERFSKPFCMQKKSLLSKWSQFDKIISCITEYEFKDTDYLKRALEDLSCMSCSDSPHYQFLYAQLQFLHIPPEGRRLDRNLYILAAELYNISPAAYKMLRKFGSIVLLRVELSKKLLSYNLHDENLKQLFQSFNLSSVLSTFFLMK